jgi:iron complex outermembrane recepter protein
MSGILVENAARRGLQWRRHDRPLQHAAAQQHGVMTMAKQSKGNSLRARSRLRKEQTLRYAIAAILSGTSAGHVLTAAAADATPGVEQIQEITVTAQRRTENIQDVPIAIQALTNETLSQLHVSTLDQFIRYLPNVTAPSSGPGQSQIFMRGLSVGSDGIQSGGSISGFPNVAIYLDDQSGQLPGRNLDVYAVDLERVEVLEGPQGTLFGAGAQAGAVRYITNKPKLNVTEGSVTAGYGTTAGGDPNSELTAVINLPLIADKLAVRAAIYNDQRGGYINNVASTFTRKSTDLGIGYANYPDGCGATGTCQVPPGAVAINNNGIAQNAFNPVSYKGIRVSALWAFNDDWSALLAQSYQNLNAQGVFYQMPNSSDGDPLPKQSVTLFNNSYNKDKFTNTALTVNGRIGALKAVYTGAYLIRDVNQVQDYTNYSRGVYADYYQCHGAEPANGLAATCFSPSAIWRETERNTHQSHEIRLSTPDDWRLRGIVGAFWEELQIKDQLDWQYKSLPPCTDTLTVGCLTNVAPAPGATVSNPNTRNDNTAFFNDVTRGYKQRAFFASVDFDLIPKVLTVTAGTRYYHFDNTEKGAYTSSFGCYEAGPAPCLNNANNIDTANLHTTYKGFKSRANITWHIQPDVLVYATWSQGFRPGGFNRFSANYVPDPASGIPQYQSPYAFKSDNLTNKELGWKTQFFNHRLQWNGAIYQEDWKDVQINLFNPGVLGNIGFGTNGPSYRIRGVETSIIAVLAEGLTANAGASWNSSKQTNSPFLIANNPDLLNDPATAALYGQPITSIQNVFGPLGTPSANSPPFQFNLRLRYQWNIDSYNAFVQAGGTHTAHSYTQAGVNPALSAGGSVSTTLLRFENPSYSQYDMSAGIGRDAWTVEVYALNLTNENKSVFTSTTQFVPAETITRPRVLGVKVGYKF